MNKNIRNIIIGVGVAVLLGFFFGLTESLTRVRWGMLSWWLPAFMGAFTYYILFNLSGTRKESKADTAVLADAMAFAAPTGQARVYVLRTGFAGKAAGMNVLLDGVPVAQLKSPRFTVVDMTPGAHEFRAHFSGGAGTQNRECSVKVDVAAGSITVLRISVELGMLKNQLLIAPVDLDSARAELKRATMVVAEKA